MSGRKTMSIVATPSGLTFTEKQGYVLRVKITEGPANMLDRIVLVRFTADQLNLISDWCPDLNGLVYPKLELAK